MKIGLLGPLSVCLLLGLVACGGSPAGYGRGITPNSTPTASQAAVPRPSPTATAGLGASPTPTTTPGSGASLTPTVTPSQAPSLTPTPTANPGPARTPIGSVVRKTDVVELGRTVDTLSPVQGTASLFPGDVLKIHSGGEGWLDFGDQLILQLFNNSQLGVVSSNLPGSPADKRFELDDGGFTGQKVDPGGQAVFTVPGGAQITVLGTDFLLAYDPATGVTTVGNFHGTVEVAGHGVQVALASGNAVVVPAGQVPGVQVPIQFTLEQFQQQARSLNSPVQAANRYVSLAGSLALAVSDSHACALTLVGGLACWGNNDQGQLGDGGTKSSSFPVDVVGLKGRVVQVAMANTDTCAVTQDGRAVCWGSNSNGTTELAQSSKPFPLSWPSGPVASVAPGNGFTCVLTVKGGVECQGKVSFGQLSDGSLTSGVLAITTGLRDHTCALMAGGGVKCWGYAIFGELGNGQDGDGPKPVDVVGLKEPVTAVVAGEFHTCALTLAGGVKCWGSNGDGQIGNPAVDRSTNIPVDVVGLTSGVRAITASHTHTCALTTAGGVKCWGGDHLGDGKAISSGTPVDVYGLQSRVAAIAAGGSNTCALMLSGAVRCWGDNTYGQLGNGTTVASDIPVDVFGLGPPR